MLKTKNRKWLSYLVDVGGIFLGSLFYALGIAFFLQPNDMVAGGVGGISTILDHYTGIETGTWVMLLNVPLLALALWKFGWKFFIYTLMSVGFSSVQMNIILIYFPNPLVNDPLLAAFGGGALVALGLGVIFRCHGTTGGSDIIARLLKLRFPHIKTGVLIMALDVIVVTASIIAFGKVELGLYSALGIFAQAYLFDAVLYGSDSAKLVYIVCKHPEEMAGAFLTELNVGVTAVDGKGAYTGEDRVVLLCAMHKKVLPQARAVVRRIDPKAFLIVTPATQIFGEGFLNHDREEI